MEKITFKGTPSGKQFYEEVKQQVNQYFTDHKICPHANNEMRLKGLLFIACWMVTWAMVIVWKDYFVLAVLMGVAHFTTHLLIAFNIAHDANHGALFKSRRLNHVFGYFMELIGCNKQLWVIAHNQEHHTFINIHEHDNNVDGYKMLRFTPKDTWRSHHRFQHYYAGILYALSTLNYATLRDFKLLARHIKLKKLKPDLPYLAGFLFFKLFYYTYLFVIPIMIFKVSFWIVLTYFLIGHMVNGLALVFVFLTGHLTEDAHYPDVADGEVADNWAVHVVKTTSDYSPNSRWLHWLAGSLNLHVAHHLFPKICHVHYKHITPIIKRVALKHGVAYKPAPTFGYAIASHFKLLKQLGRNEVVA
ncbi:MAG TPA: acyl-CoA desaturase [Phnomibacter sp.]|nr:acyl-CoA desaturase [Phnomibacter sp.]